VWIRPDGLTLIGPVGLLILAQKSGLSQKVKATGQIVVGAGLLILAYGLFNQSISGSWYPNTYYAKQAEYAIMQQIPYWRRVLNESGALLVGVGILLLPGVIIHIKKAATSRDWWYGAWLLWIVGYLGLYAWRLPVTYQHGRYIIPVMPVYFLMGLIGVIQGVNFSFPKLWVRVVSKAWVLVIGMVSIGFALLGGQAFGRDVALIESEMVDSASWIAKNTSPGSVIAAHDIGALGYFGEREIIDLAGLISPEVIPFIRDEQRLADYMTAAKADYLMTFPGWYPSLVAGRISVYQSRGKFSLNQGGENMAVYRWESP
jgi:hypothetical protein